MEMVVLLLETLIREIRHMSAEFDRLVTEVAETRTAQASLIALVEGLAQQIRDNATDPAALKALADSLDAGQGEIAAAITANTPTPPLDPNAPPASPRPRQR